MDASNLPWALLPPSHHPANKAKHDEGESRKRMINYLYLKKLSSIPLARDPATEILVFVFHIFI